MTEGVLIDNDVVLKLCAYRCQDELVAAATLGASPPAILNIAQFTLRSRLAGRCGIADREGATAAFEKLLGQVKLLDPSPDEIELAAELEEQANRRALEFDTGESQLVAILLSRRIKLLITGDKRAVVALNEMGLLEVEGRIACLEQFVAMLLIRHPHNAMRQRICAELTVDKTITNCFACSVASISVQEIITGLSSYINHLQEKTGSVLIRDADLLSIVP